MSLPISTPHQSKQTIIPSSPPQLPERPQQEIMRQYLYDWYLPRKGNGGDWYDDVKRLCDHIYSERFDLKTLQGLPKEWFDDADVKTGLRISIQSNVKQF